MAEKEKVSYQTKDLEKETVYLTEKNIELLREAHYLSKNKRKNQTVNEAFEIGLNAIIKKYKK